MFKTLTNLTGGSAMTLLLAASTSALAGGAETSAEPPVYLICGSDQDTSVCKALADVLTLAAKQHDVRVVSEDTPVPDPHYMTIRFVQNVQTDDSISGYLVWQAAGGALETGPTLEISAMDTVLTDQMLSDFAKQLLQSSNIQM